MPFPEGFGLRPPRPADAEAIVAMMNAETEAFIGVPVASIDWVANMWTAPSADLEADFAVVHSEAGDLAGYLLVQGHPPYTEVFAVGVVALPYHRRGLGSAIVAETERRAGRLVKLAPPQRRVVMHAGALADEPRVSGLLSQHGYVEVRRLSQMQIDFEQPPPAPDGVPGIEIRPLVTGQESAVYACISEAFDDDWSESFPTEEDWIHSHVTGVSNFRPELWWLAWEGPTLAGALIGLPSADEDAALGYVGLLGVRRAFRGRGIAEALLRTSFVQFHSLGRPGVCLHVDTESVTGATRLYERVGMAIHPRFATWEKELRPAGAPELLRRRVVAARGAPPANGVGVDDLGPRVDRPPQPPELARIVDQEPPVLRAERDALLPVRADLEDGGLVALRELAGHGVQVGRHLTAGTCVTNVTDR